MQDQNQGQQRLLNDSEADTRENVESSSIDRSAYEMNSILDQNDPQNAAKAELKKLRDNEVRKRDTIWQRVFSPILPGSIRGSIFALACTALGVGSLALPKVVSFVGVILGTFMIICAGLINKFMIDVLVLAVERTNKFNYPSIVEVILGKKYKNILLAVLVCYLLGALVGYMVVIGDLGPKVLHAAFKIENNDLTRILVILIIWSVMLPFQFAKELNFLSRFSIIGILTLVYCVLLMIGEAYIFIGNNDYSNLPTDWYIKFDIHFPQAWALCAFAFICHSNVFPIQGELYQRSIKRMKKVTRRVSITLTILYTIIAVLGFICFFSDIPDIFINRKRPDEIKNDYLMNIAKTLLICTLMIGLPLNHFPCSFVTITLVLNITYLGLAIALPSILTVLSIIGGSFGVLHAMALPNGVIADIEATTNEIVKASSLPLSIIIVGVGKEDFSQMHYLDADDQPLYSNEHRKQMERDIVQFVPFSKFKNNAHDLAHEVLEEVPNQVLTYFENNSIKPGIQGQVKRNTSLIRQLTLEPSRDFSPRSPLVPQKNEGLAVPKVPSHLYALKEKFKKQVLSIGIDQFKAEAILDKGIAAMDINLMIEILSSQQIKNFNPKNLIKREDTSRKSELTSSLSQQKSSVLSSNRVAVEKPKVTFKNQDQLCKVCYANNIDIVLLECGHRIVCQKCVKQCGKSCPSCRATITRQIKTYNV